jgi:hypothetical protein
MVPVIRREEVPLTVQGLALDFLDYHDVSFGEYRGADDFSVSLKRGEKLEACWPQLVQPFVCADLVYVSGITVSGSVDMSAR